MKSQLYTVLSKNYINLVIQLKFNNRKLDYKVEIKHYMGTIKY